MCVCIVLEVIVVNLTIGGGSPEKRLPPPPPTSSVPPTLPLSPSIRSLLFVGDSITFGQNQSGDPYPRPYPYVAVSTLVSEMGCPVTFRVVAVPGGHMTPNVPPHPVLSHPLWKSVILDSSGYDAVVFFLAINDAFYHEFFVPDRLQVRSGQGVVRRSVNQAFKKQRLLAGLNEFTTEFSRRRAKVLFIPSLRFEPVRFSKGTAARKRSLTDYVLPTIFKWSATPTWSVLLHNP